MYPISSARTSKTRRRLETGTAPGKDAHAIAVAPADEAKAVVFDFMHPLRPGWHSIGQGREARRAKERFSQELDLLPEKPNRDGRRLAAAA
jgi:hypothetical protein